MNVELFNKDSAIILRLLDKKIDTSVAPELKKKLLSIIANDSPNLVIDLKQVKYMDSSGLGALLFGRRQAERFQGNLVLINPGTKIKKLFDIAHLSKMLIIFKSEKAAVNHFSKK